MAITTKERLIELQELLATALREIEPKAPWTLPDPPPGRSWHRADGWTEEMLPEGYRPLLLRELPVVGEDQWIVGGAWRTQRDCDSRFPVGRDYLWHRTRRPLPVDPPPPVMIPLDAADVPPGSSFRRSRDKAMAWQIACSAGDYGVRLINEFNQCHSWAELRDYYQILRPGRDPVTGWEPCQKEQKPA